MSEPTANPVKEVIETIRSYFFFMLKRWLVFVIIGVVCIGAAFYFYNKNKSDDYIGGISFMLEERGGAGGSTISGLLGSFGFSSGGGSETSEEMIINLLSTRRIVSDAIFKKMVWNGKNDYIANHYIEAHDWRNTDWKDYPDMQDFKFRHSHVDSFNDTENSVLKKIVGSINSNNMMGAVNKAGIIGLRCRMKDDKLLIGFLNSLINSLSYFYMHKTVEGSQNAYYQLMQRRDSIEGLLKNAEFAFASFQDKSRGMISNTSTLNGLRLQRNVEIYTVLFQEAVKNVEIAHMNLSNEQPFLQVVDRPLPPLARVQVQLKSYLVKGVLFALFLGIVILAATKLLQDELRKT